VKLDMLDDLKDEQLQAAIEHAQALLKQRDEDRKTRALGEARTLLASVGLTLKDLSGKTRGRAAKGPLYQAGHLYQHPANKSLTWTAKGQKPRWLREIEAAGGKPIEVASETGGR
jgi:DNA-binding protein H-NS